jgi:transposase
MSVCVGIDVHRKRSQVAVVNESGEVLANRNVPDGTETILGVMRHRVALASMIQGAGGAGY